MLEFTLGTAEYREILLSLCREGISGTEAYTELHINTSSACGNFWLGKNEENEIQSLVFDNGDEYIRVYGDEFPELFSFSERPLMIYKGTENIPDENSLVKFIIGKDVLDMYRLIGEGKMTFDDERRYVKRLHCIKQNLGAVFGIYKDKELISVSCVSAMNEKYALISDVFTKKEFRKKGFARLCVNKAVSYSLERGKVPYLRCEKEMCSYYEKSGFVYYGKM